MNDRIKKVNELVKETLGNILKEDFSYENVLISISYVKTTQDLKSSRVFVTVFPYDKKEEVLDFLKQSLPKIQALFGNTIELKFTPKLEILFDESYEYEAQIEDLCRKIENDKMNR